MIDLSEFVTGGDLVNQWGIRKFQLTHCVGEDSLQAYSPENFCKMNKRLVFWDQKDAEQHNADRDGFELLFRALTIEDCLFKKSDVSALLGEQESASAAKDKERFERAIDAAIRLVLFCQSESSEKGRLCTRAEAQDFIDKEFRRQITDREFRAIWRKMPEELRHRSGAPKGPRNK